MFSAVKISFVILITVTSAYSSTLSTKKIIDDDDDLLSGYEFLWHDQDQLESKTSKEVVPAVAVVLVNEANDRRPYARTADGSSLERRRGFKNYQNPQHHTIDDQLISSSNEFDSKKLSAVKNYKPTTERNVGDRIVGDRNVGVSFDDNPFGGRSVASSARGSGPDKIDWKSLVPHFNKIKKENPTLNPALDPNFDPNTAFAAIQNSGQSFETALKSLTNNLTADGFSSSGSASHNETRDSIDHQLTVNHQPTNHQEINHHKDNHQQNNLQEIQEINHQLNNHQINHQQNNHHQINHQPSNYHQFNTDGYPDQPGGAVAEPAETPYHNAKFDEKANDYVTESERENHKETPGDEVSEVPSLPSSPSSSLSASSLSNDEPSPLSKSEESKPEVRPKNHILRGFKPVPGPIPSRTPTEPTELGKPSPTPKWTIRQYEYRLDPRDHKPSLSVSTKIRNHQQSGPKSRIRFPSQRYGMPVPSLFRPIFGHPIPVPLPPPMPGATPHFGPFNSFQTINPNNFYDQEYSVPAYGDVGMMMTEMKPDHVDPPPQQAQSQPDQGPKIEIVKEVPTAHADGHKEDQPVIVNGHRIMSPKEFSCCEMLYGHFLDSYDPDEPKHHHHHHHHPSHQHQDHHALHSMEQAPHSGGPQAVVGPHTEVVGLPVQSLGHSVGPHHRLESPHHHHHHHKGMPCELMLPPPHPMYLRPKFVFRKPPFFFG